MRDLDFRRRNRQANNVPLLGGPPEFSRQSAMLHLARVQVFFRHGPQTPVPSHPTCTAPPHLRSTGARAPSTTECLATRTAARRLLLPPYTGVVPQPFDTSNRYDTTPARCPTSRRTFNLPLLAAIVILTSPLGNVTAQQVVNSPPPPAMDSLTTQLQLTPRQAEMARLAYAPYIARHKQVRSWMVRVSMTEGAAAAQRLTAYQDSAKALAAAREHADSAFRTILSLEQERRFDHGPSASRKPE